MVMRRIGSDKGSESKKRRNVLIGIILLALMIFSTLGYAFITSDRTSTSNPLSTSNSTTAPVNVGGKWIVTIHGQQFLVQHTPEQTSNVSVEITKDLNSYFDQFLYIDSENQEVTLEISSTLGRFSSRVQEACYGPCERDIPEKDCSVNMIVWRNSSENKVTQQENCIFIEGDLHAVDAFIFKLLGS